MRTARPSRLGAAAAVTLLCFSFALHPLWAGDPTTGWLGGAAGVQEGYTLFHPSSGSDIFLIDNFGRVVHSWDGITRPGNAVYLLENGNLLRAAKLPGGTVLPISAGGVGGRVQLIAWDSTLLWQYEYSSPTFQAHHDVEILPNGNVLILAWELKTQAEALAAGRDPALLTQNELWPEHIIEVQQTGPTTGTIVWEWHLWDHLVQDFDPAQANFGVVADHPELVNINAAANGSADWIHANSIDYNADLDQIVISANRLDEIWIIDHSTTTAEAAGHTGGNSGRGGDILYRWGNPQNYDAGTPADKKLFRQHCVEWIPNGYPGAGNILIFNNGNNRPGGSYTSIDEIEPPIDMNGDYILTPGTAYGPANLTWTYSAPNPTDFFASFISGARRLPNGNTIICNGPVGTFFEVNDAGDTVWTYKNPVTGSGAIQQGESGSGSCFRTNRYAPDYPGLMGQVLTPMDPLETYPAFFDYNDDGMVSGTDYDCFVDAFTGPCPTATCDDPIYFDAMGFMSDADGDGDVDCDDWAEFQLAWAGMPIDLPACSGSGAQFIRGDATQDSNIDIADAIRALGFLFSQDAVDCELALDMNDDENVDISDPIYLLAALFGGGPAIPAPVTCDVDPTPGSIGCDMTACP